MNSLSDNWIDVNSALPHPEYHNTNTIGTYLVTVEMNDRCEHDDNEVTEAIFNYSDLTWRYICDHGKTKYDPTRDIGWKVIAWQELPKPYER
jgi:hypothetical protein